MVGSIIFALQIHLVHINYLFCLFFLIAAARSANTRKRKNKHVHKAQASREVAEFLSKVGAKFDCKQRKKKMRSDVEAAVFLATKNLKTSPDVQTDLGLSQSQTNKRIRTIKQGRHRLRTVSVVVRCHDCCRYLWRFENIKLPCGDDKPCDCDEE